ncbi:hypothetical protein TNCV_2060251 [Trichonephila clavipes]|nr:hypothetical protein TNCV_2060251 [Trichonephila clavipes]
MGSNPGEDMNVCKCIMPLRHGGTLNIRRTASPIVGLVEGEESFSAGSENLYINVRNRRIPIALPWGLVTFLALFPNQVKSSYNS